MHQPVLAASLVSFAKMLDVTQLLIRLPKSFSQSVVSPSNLENSAE